MSEYFTASPALHTGEGHAAGRTVQLTVSELGKVSVPSGTLGMGDPGYADPDALLQVPVPPGEHPVLVTRFVRTRDDGTPWTCNAALSVIIAGHGNGMPPEARRGPLPTSVPGADPDGCDVVGVDGGEVAVLDWTAFHDLWERDEEALETYFLDELSALSRPLDVPLLGRPENVITDSSGYGDGGYPVYGSFSAKGQLLAVHVDFNNAGLTASRFRS
ncbi:DUF4241 domain-containing protein [Streptomyces sp. NA04227]|uniref:DUF4241 domain-containing protein n=1 Tax=Streptomyces sp. NA04227 TaxID=2742136 RepID=UPI0015929B46|nr:DUF4241 domain-containing protein [Streptomyces sp. NA04227]QKW07499.1 DUF4241 domain-containing protein [Streptomyces sp. NA04227]